ncbi:MAG TPA: hypothetical protein VMG10_33735 [Gemmataceae bacterium]|nr:hypothetical protein [Gemmataceae bacterium]
MSRWKLIWLLILLLAVGGWAAGFWLAYLHRNNSEWANYAGIAGLCLAIIGFPFTIYSLFETQRAGREAQRQAAEAAREAKAAVEQSRADTKQALEKVALMLLAGDLERLQTAVNAVLDFGDHAIWPRALLHCREAGALAAALRVNPLLRENERTMLAQGAEALAIAQTYITDNRINKNTTRRGLYRTHAKNLQSLAMSLTVVRARLSAISLEAPHAPVN